MKVEFGAGAVLALAGVGVLGYVAWKMHDSGAGVVDTLKDAAGKVADAINPASSSNLVNRGVSAVGGALVTAPDGNGKNADGSWTLGGWLHDITNPTTAEAVRQVTSGSIAQPKRPYTPWEGDWPTPTAYESNPEGFIPLGGYDALGNRIY